MNRRKFFETSLWGSVAVGAAIKGEAVTKPEVTINVAEKPGWLGDALDAEIAKNGKIRKTIKLVAVDA